MANKNISVGVKITGNAQSFKSASTDAQKASEKLKSSISKNTNSIKSSFSSVDDQLKSLIGTIGAVVIAQKALNAVWETFVRSVKESGVRAAFIRLNDPNLLDNLRKATHGTVNDLKLMTAAVQSKNLGIALNQLPLYFEFATRRAKDTGQAVDELVQNIVDGVGKQSVRVIDNLGISAVELKKELDKTGDFAKAVGNIMKKSMAEAGDYIEDTTDSLAQMTAQLDNIKSKAGTLFGEAGMSGTVDVLSEALNVLNTLLVENGKGIDDNTLKVWQWKRALGEYLDVLNKVIIAKRKEKNEYLNSTLEIPAAEPIVKSIETLESLKAKRQEINDQIEKTNILDTKNLSILYKQRDAIDQKIAAVEKLGQKTWEELATGIDLELFRRKFKDIDKLDKELSRIRKNINVLYEKYDANLLTTKDLDNLSTLTRAFDLLSQVRKELVLKEKGQVDFFGLPSLSVIDDYKNKLAEITESIKPLKLNIEKITTAGLTLASEFESIFQSMEDGWDNFSDAVSAAIQRIMIKIGALIAAYMVLNALTGGSFGGTMSLGNFILKGFGLEDLSGIGGTSQGLKASGVGTVLTAELKGRDIALSNNRYNQTLIKNT